MCLSELVAFPFAVLVCWGVCDQLALCCAYRGDWGAGGMAGCGAAPLFECCEVELSGCVPELVARGVGFAVHGGRSVGVDPPEAPFCGERECGLGPKNFFIFLLH